MFSNLCCPIGRRHILAFSAASTNDKLFRVLLKNTAGIDKMNLLEKNYLQTLDSFL